MPEASHTDEQLIDLIKAGNKVAFDKVFRQYYQYLCNFAFQFLKEKEASEEVVQDFFFKLWDKREDLSIQSSLKSYLFRSVQNRCLNQIKHLTIKEKYKTYNQEQIHLQENTPSDYAVEVELAEKISLSIEALPKERQRIFNLSRNEGLKYKEIAEQLDISVKTVESQMGKALKFLREQLAEYLPSLILMCIYLIEKNYS